MAKIMGPLSALRPEEEVDPLAMPSLAPSTPQGWQHVPPPKSIWDDPVGMRQEGRGLDLRTNTRSSVESPYGTRKNASVFSPAPLHPANGPRSLHTSSAGEVNTSKSFTIDGEPAGKRLLSGVLAGKEREAGVGLGLGERNGRIEVVSVVPGEAADESREVRCTRAQRSILRRQRCATYAETCVLQVFERNVLVSVDDLPLRQMSMEQILSLVNGPAGSKVKLGLIRLAGSLGGMRDEDVMVSVELTRGENAIVREQGRYNVSVD